jgi:uncharacterized membrane protein
MQTPGADGSSFGGVSQEDRLQAMLCWLLGIVLPIISPIIFMLVGQNKSFVFRNAIQCLTFHLVILILEVALAFVAVATCGIGAILYIPLALWGLIVSIMGAIAANNGQVYAPPATGNLARQWFKV